MSISLELTQYRPRRLTLGIAVSVLVHALLLLVYRIDGLRQPQPLPDAPESLFVLVKPEPRRKPEPALTQPAAAKKARSTTQPSAPVVADVQRYEPDETPPPVIAVDRSTAPDPFHMPQVTEKPFDVEAARAAARRIATAPDPARADLPVGQFDKQRNQIATETRLAREISKAERPDCKDGIPGLFGGILSPLNLLTDKKDHGCKW